MNIQFSIIIPTYNRAHLIEPTLQSCLSQEYKYFEVIIIDDGGNDNTEEVIQELNDERLKYFKVKNGERGAARNFGVQQATGDYITFLDSDDLVYPNHLSTAQAIIQNENLPLFHQAYEMKDGKGNVLMQQVFKERMINKRLLKGNVMSCIGVFIQREIALENPFSEVRQLSGTEDWLLWLKIAARYEWRHFPTITSCMMNHDTRSVLQFDEAALLARTNYLYDELRMDDQFVNKYGMRSLDKIKAHMFSYMSLHALMNGEKNIGFNYLLRAVSINSSELFTRRALAIIKKILFS